MAIAPTDVAPAVIHDTSGLWSVLPIGTGTQMASDDDDDDDDDAETVSTFTRRNIFQEAWPPPPPAGGVPSLPRQRTNTRGGSTHA